MTDDDIVNMPQMTNCTTIEFESGGVANGFLKQAKRFGYEVTFDKEDDVYRVGDYNEENDSVMGQ